MITTFISLYSLHSSLRCTDSMQTTLELDACYSYLYCSTHTTETVSVSTNTDEMDEVVEEPLTWQKGWWSHLTPQSEGCWAHSLLPVYWSTKPKRTPSVHMERESKQGVEKRGRKSGRVKVKKDRGREKEDYCVATITFIPLRGRVFLSLYLPSCWG